MLTFCWFLLSFVFCFDFDFLLQKERTRVQSQSYQNKLLTVYNTMHDAWIQSWSAGLLQKASVTFPDLPSTAYTTCLPNSGKLHSLAAAVLGGYSKTLGIFAAPGLHPSWPRLRMFGLTFSARSLYSWEFYCYWGGPILASPSTMPQLFYVTPRAFKTNTIWIILPLPIQPPEVGTQPWPPPEHSFCMLTEQTLPRRLYFNTADLFLISINSLAPADHLSQ